MEFKQSKNKPFIIVKNKKEKFIICVGAAQVCEKQFDTVEQTERYIGTKPYELIFNTMFYILDLKKNEKEVKETAESSEKN